jgi:glycosyltransferase involved in cell wall biosynthesis
VSVAAAPHLSILVPTYARSELIERTVRAWTAQRFDHALEVVVIDDGSPDDTSARLARLAAEDPRVVSVRQPNRGRSVARNAALARARGRWLLFADDDVSPLDDTTLARWLDRAEREGGAWVPRVHVPPEAAQTTLQQAWRQRLSGARSWRDGHRFGAGGFWFAAMLIERTIIGDMRFDETFDGYGWEDMEFGYRLHRRGVRSRLAGDVEVWHADPITLDVLERKYESLGRQGWNFVRRHPRLGVRIWTGTWWPVRAGKALLGVERRGRAARPRVAAIADIEGAALSPAFVRDLGAVLEGAYARGTRLGAPRRRAPDPEVPHG